MWSRDDIYKEARAARDRAVANQCFSVPILEKIMMNVAARMALENAATIAHTRYGDVSIRDAIDDYKLDFNLTD